jgi:hypothetical protein
MSAAEDPIAIIIECERVRKVRQAGAAGAGLGGSIAVAAVAVYTNTNLLSAAVADFALRWAIAIGLVATVLGALYLGVRS